MLFQSRLSMLQHSGPTLMLFIIKGAYVLDVIFHQTKSERKRGKKCHSQPKSGHLWSDKELWDAFRVSCNALFESLIYCCFILPYVDGFHHKGTFNLISLGKVCILEMANIYLDVSEISPKKCRKIGKGKKDLQKGPADFNPFKKTSQWRV